MVKSSRKGIGERKINTIIIVDGDYQEDDILFCSSELEYLEYKIKYKNMVYSLGRNTFLDRMKQELKGHMPEVIHLKIIKKLGVILK
ncbi:MAG TPA: hypothetical protein VMV77_01340 [Bacteroidales bacterium]|nr:hypothetical protein [Bacteroidales bacterium]